MPTITQYRPEFISGFKQKEAEFTSNEELLNIPFVKSFSKEKGFDSYLVLDMNTEKYEGEILLVAKYFGKTLTNSQLNLVVGCLSGIEGLNLKKEQSDTSNAYLLKKFANRCKKDQQEASE